MATYTADAVALLRYLVDALPAEADRVFREAEAGETIIQAPSTAIGEVLYSVSRDKNVRGATLQGTPDRARRALLEGGPVSLSTPSESHLVELTDVVGEFSIHDGFVVASHRAADTDAILTIDDAIAGAGYETVWA